MEREIASLKMSLWFYIGCCWFFKRRKLNKYVKCKKKDSNLILVLFVIVAYSQSEQRLCVSYGLLREVVVLCVFGVLLALHDSHTEKSDT